MTDLEALRYLNRDKKPFEFLYVDLPNGKRQIEDMTHEELIEICYLLQSSNGYLRTTILK